MKNEPAILSSGELSKQQLDAIKLITSGCTPKYAALVLKVKYSVIKKWISHDEQFKAKLAKQSEASQKNDPQEPAAAKPQRKSDRSENTAKRTSN